MNENGNTGASGGTPGAEPSREFRLPRPGGMGPHGGGIRGGGEKAKNFKATALRLLAYIARYRIQLVFVFVFAALGTVFSVVGPRVLGMATTKIFEGLTAKISGLSSGSAGIDFASIGKIIGVLACLYVLSSLFSYVQGFIMAGVAQHVSYTMRRSISEKINRMPLSYFDSHTHGEVLSRITNDVDTVSSTLNQSLSQIVTAIVTVVGVLIMMFTINWLMTVTALCILPLTFVFTSLIVKKSQKYFKNQQKFLGAVNGHVEEMYGGHIVIKAFNREDESLKVFSSYNDKLYQSAWKSDFLSGLMMPAAMFVGNLGYVVITILGAWLAIRKTITVGDIQAFIQYVRLFTQPVSQIAQITNILQSAAAAAERVFEFLDESEEIHDTEHPVMDREELLRTIKGDIGFDHVRFGYRKDKIIIHDFSSSAEQGQHIAIVGPTGAGKTTIVKLLMRFYDVAGGAIRLDGNDIKQYRRSDLRDVFGMVLQDTWLFNGTIMENIRYGRLDATDEEVVAAAKAANADRFIRTLPGSYQMVLNEDASNISQGEKQLLTIARAILSEPYILIFDEATSSIDTRTEIYIKHAMDKMMNGKTSFIIAHRLSTIRDADLILVMKDGDIVEQGDHKTLLEKNGFYASLYRAQFTAG